MTNDLNPTDVELTEEEMHQSGGTAAIIAGVVLGHVIGFGTMFLLEWNDRRKAKKNAQNEN